jgi:hypothetical protein
MADRGGYAGHAPNVAPFAEPWPKVRIGRQDAAVDPTRATDERVDGYARSTSDRREIEITVSRDGGRQANTAHRWAPSSASHVACL